ncbi:MAG TPA: energy-coupling factor transporter transmembrane component T, partial [Candidatus Goldiibacteriota bacterium]|nr:energy-coupling factor transporter transmembrane component T [Candidatus Goldiibacteriota bacterium]
MGIMLYSDKKTAVHGLDPRVKLAGLLWLFFAAAISSDTLSLAVVCGINLVFFIISDTAASLKKTGLMVALIGCVTFMLWIVFYRGEEAGRYAFSSAMSLRFVSMLLSGILFLSVTSAEEIVNGLRLAGLPYPAAFTVALSIRLAGSFMNTAFVIAEAQAARGNDAVRGSIISRIKAFAPLMAPLILNGIKKAETLHLALES